jgi:hypothetical protein
MRLSLRYLLTAAMCVVASCSSTSEPDGLSTPEEVQATALGLNAVRVTWKASSDPEAAYDVERRRDLAGDFETIATAIRGDGAATVSYFDTTVEPDHYYGYRIQAVNRLGARSGLSTVAGARTASVPGVRIRVSTTFATPKAADPDGFIASVRGPRDSSSYTVAINGERLVAPLPKGVYRIALRGLAVNCNPVTAGDTIKTVTVTDEGLNTVGVASFQISCRDPEKASIVTTVRVAGDTVDADGVQLTVSGIVREANTPADERVYFQTRTLQGTSASARFDDLRPGDYEVTISDVEAPCTLEGERTRMLQPKKLAVDTVPFQLTCRKPVVPVDTAGRPFVMRHSWSVTSAKPGDKISLLTALDLRAEPATRVTGASATVQFDNAVVRFDSARTTRAFDVTAINQPQANVVAFAAAQTGGEPLAGNIEIVRSWFTVVGAVGTRVTTSTTLGEVLTPSLQRLNTKVRVTEAALTVTAGGGGPVNQAPTAVINAPTTGAVGAPLTFNGSASSDPDGTIVSYAWTFGNGQSATGATASQSYAAAGTYTVRLTVTDNAGASASRDHTVVISAAAPTTGTISGTVSSSGGALSGVTVSVSGGPSATTSATGAYALSGVAAGARSVSVSGLPAGCTAPAAQSVTVTAGSTVTANFSVTCGSSGPTTGSVTGRVLRADGTGIGFARVTVQPTGGAALPAVTTAVDGSYSVANVPSGAGTIAISELPTGCTVPAAQPYSGVSAGASVTVNVTVTCAVATTGTVAGRITKSTGGNATGVVVTVTPAGASALPTVTTSSTGSYTVAGVPAGNGTLSLSSLPSGCSAPGNLTYTGVTAGGTLTRDIVLTCVAAAHTYPVTATWGTITNGGPTGRQVTLSFAIDMGGAPGRTDIAGNAADPLAGISLQVRYDGTKLAYQSRSLLSPDEFDLGVAGSTGGGTATAITTVSVASSSAQTKTGAFGLVRITFNIASGASGTITPVVTVPEALATASLVAVTTSVVVESIPPLVIAP